MRISDIDAYVAALEAENQELRAKVAELEAARREDRDLSLRDAKARTSFMLAAFMHADDPQALARKLVVDEPKEDP